MWTEENKENKLQRTILNGQKYLCYTAKYISKCARFFSQKGKTIKLFSPQQVLKKEDKRIIRVVPITLFYGVKNNQVYVDRAYPFLSFGSVAANNRIGGGYVSDDKKIYLFDRKIILDKTAAFCYDGVRLGKKLREEEKQIGETIKSVLDDFERMAANIPATIEHEKKHYQNDRQFQKICFENKIRLSLKDIYGLRVLDELSGYTQMMMFSRNEYLKNPSEATLKGFSWSLSLLEELQNKTPAQRKEFLTDEKQLFAYMEQIFYGSFFYEGHKNEFAQSTETQAKMMASPYFKENPEKKEAVLRNIQKAFLTFSVYDTNLHKEKLVCFDTFDRQRLTKDFPLPAVEMMQKTGRER
jgi:hypothetical protein